MKSLIFTLLLLLSFTQGYKLVRREIEKDVVEDISLILKGWIDSWQKRGEDMNNITACYNSTKGSANTIAEIVKLIIKGNFTYDVIMKILHNLFKLTKQLIDEFNVCKKAGGLFIDIINRLKEMTPYKILERILTRIYQYNEELWESLSKGIGGIKYRKYYDIGYGLGDFIEVLLLMND